MSVKSLYADEHFPMPVVNQLRAKGHVVRTVRDDCDDKGGDGFDDETVLRIATQHKLAVITMNRKDFEALHQRVGGHYGIIIVSYPDVERKQDMHTVMAKKIDDELREIQTLQAQLVRI